MALFTKTKYILTLTTTLLFISSCLVQNDGNAPTTGSGSSSSSSCTTCKIFVTTLTFNGNLGGVSGADQKCNDDAQSGTSTYKALIGGRGGDWPLQANTVYINAAGQTIGTTNDSSQFAFPVTNAIGAGSVWTGLTNAWNDFNTCNSWTDSSGGVNSNTGDASSKTTGMLNTTIPTCNNIHALYCVQQF